MKAGEVRVGNKVKDRITGFTGIVTCLSLYLNGCERVQVQNEGLKDGKRLETEHMDSADVILINKGYAKDDIIPNTAGYRDAEREPFPVTQEV